MGKGNRNSQKRLANASVNQAEAKNKNTKKNSGKAVAVACIAFAVLIVAVLVLNVLTEVGVFIRATNAVWLEDVVVDAAMMSFFYNDYLMSWYNNYGGYIGYLGLNFQASLKLQQFPKGGLAGYILGEEYDGTWYDYFLEKVTENVEMYVTFCDAANKSGIKLDAEDLEDVEENVKAVMDSIKASGSSLGDWFGRGVNEDDIRRCYKMIKLASKYSEYKYDLLEKEIEDEEAEGKKPVSDFVEENKEDFYTAEVLSYKIKVTSKNYTDAEFDAKVAKAKADAEKIAAAGNVENFLKLVKEYELANDIKHETETKKETGTATETETETKTLEEQADEYRDTIKYETETGTGTGDSLEDWLFVEGATEGDGKIFEETGEETVKPSKPSTTEKETDDVSESETETAKKPEVVKFKTYTVTAYVVTKGMHLDTDLTNNFAFLIGDDKAMVEAFLAQFKELDEQSMTLFVDEAEKFHEKSHENHNHDDKDHKEPVFAYNKVEKVAKDLFKNSYFGKKNDADAWLDADRRNGDISDIFTVEIEENKEKKTYYVFIFFDSRDKEEWYVNGYNGLLNERFDDWYENESGLKDIDYNKNALDSINTIVMY